MNVIITMPVYNDWQAASLLSEQLAEEMAQAGHATSILLIDDGSSAEVDPNLFASKSDDAFVPAIYILRLGRNLGHQRAIAIALTYIHQNLKCDAVVVMDADGEDRAQDVPALLDVLQKRDGRPIVFAERGRRVEGLVFKVGYFWYRVLHRLATGHGIRIGNFSAIPAKRLSTLVLLPELWNHYAAAVLRARIPHSTVLTDRGSRLHGKSKMNFVSLVIHGLSALFAHHELVGTRIFVGISALTAMLLAGLAASAGLWLYHGWAIPMWESIALGTAVLLAGQLLAISFGLIFFIMMSRTNQGFLPIRDYAYFVDRCETIQQFRPAYGALSSQREL